MNTSARHCNRWTNFLIEAIWISTERFTLQYIALTFVQITNYRHIYTIFLNYEIIVFHRSINEIKNRYRNNYIVIEKSITFWITVAFLIIQFLCSLSTFVHWFHPRDTKNIQKIQFSRSWAIHVVRSTRSCSKRISHTRSIERSSSNFQPRSLPRNAFSSNLVPTASTPLSHFWWHWVYSCPERKVSTSRNRTCYFSNRVASYWNAGRSDRFFFLWSLTLPPSHCPSNKKQPDYILPSMRICFWEDPNSLLVWVREFY